MTFPTIEKAQLLLDVEKLLDLRFPLRRPKGLQRVDLELLEGTGLERLKTSLLSLLFGIEPSW